MSKGTNLICQCGGKIRVTPSREDHGKKKAKKVRNPGIYRIGQNYWYCTSCGRDEHILDNTPEWTLSTVTEKEAASGN